jgi:hypothetical protein
MFKPHLLSICYFYPTMFCHFISMVFLCVVIQLHPTFLSYSTISFFSIGIHPDKNVDIILLHLFLFCLSYALFLSDYCILTQ